MKMKLTLITPALANKMLRNKAGNRKICQGYCKHLADAMERGEWIVDNGQPISLDKGNILVDGQHRLSAITIRNKSIKMYVAYDINRKAYKTIDIGRKRSPGDTLSINGEDDPNKLAAIARMYNIYKKWGFDKRPSVPSYLSPQQLEKVIGENPDLRLSAAFLTKNMKSIKRFLNPTIVGIFHYIFGRKNKKNRDNFFDALLAGDRLGKNDPIYILRENLIDLKKRYSAKDKPMICCLIIKTWNNKFGGTRVDIVYKPSEKMPKVLG